MYNTKTNQIQAKYVYSENPDYTENGAFIIAVMLVTHNLLDCSITNEIEQSAIAEPETSEQHKINWNSRFQELLQHLVQTKDKNEVTMTGRREILGNLSQLAKD